MMSGDALPADGEPLVGGVRLPPGRRVRAHYGPPGPVAWITDAPVPGAGQVWRTLQDTAARTGLRPLCTWSMRMLAITSRPATLSGLPLYASTALAEGIPITEVSRWHPGETTADGRRRELRLPRPEVRRASMESRLRW
jgi:hypothetical protein